ncbi:MAG TPA: ABC transporter ATP-binding protein [Xanthobacteraceae bacterium]|nr:ABC transporter ATP-binding protein [Xanthobacteraceae bacterium]
MPERSPGAAIALSALSKRYGGSVAVEEASFTVAAGEFVSLLGPSGSGKTTILMMVAGFVAPDRGSVALGGNDITRVPPYRRNIGMVHQSYALFPHMSVQRNVAFPLRMRAMARHEIERRVAQALDLVRLTGLETRLPAQLSGGQQQRVALARALVFAPPLLLMDEPLGALDKKLRVDLQIEIKRIQREIGSTMLYVTHDQEEALSMSDRIVVMNRGRIEQIDTPGAMYERPRTRFVADFLGTSNFLAATVEAIGATAVVRTKSGLLLRTTQDAACRIGDKLTLSLRPERVRLLAPDAAQALAQGTVAEASFFGNAQRYVVRLAGGEPLIATRPSLGEPMLAAGSPVGVGWSPSDLWIIPEPRP